MGEETTRVLESMRISQEQASGGAGLARFMDQAIQLMVSLDQGMLDGRVLPAAEAEQLYDGILELARRGYVRLLAQDPARARAWQEELAVWQRPRRMDLDAWAVDQGDTLPVVERLDLDDPSVSPGLAVQLQRLQDMATQHPSQCVLGDALSAAQVTERSEELGLTFPDELVAAYRFCNGFELYRTPKGSGMPVLALAQLHTLQTFHPLCGAGSTESLAAMRGGSSAEEMMNDPSRLMLLSAGSDQISMLCVDNWEQYCIREMEGHAVEIRRASLSELLAFALAAERLRADHRWVARWSDFF